MGKSSKQQKRERRRERREAAKTRERARQKPQQPVAEKRAAVSRPDYAHPMDRVQPISRWAARRRLISYPVIAAVVVGGFFGAWRVVDFARSKFWPAPEPTPETELSPNTRRGIEDRLKATKPQTFKLTRDEDFDAPEGVLAFLNSFTETNTRFNLSPVSVTLTMTRPGHQETILPTLNAVDALAQVRAARVEGRYPVTIDVYFDNVMKVGSDGAMFITHGPVAP